MKVNIIGSGNCATALGRLFKLKGHLISQVMSRNVTEGTKLAKLLDAAYIDLNGQPDTGADLFVIALSDTALPEAVAGIPFGNVIVVHTAGALPDDILKSVSTRHGVLYPLQTFRKELEQLPAEIPFLVSGSDPQTLQTIKDFAASLSDHVTEADHEMRLRMHAAAVIVNNFTNHLYAVAKDFCDKEKVDFSLLKPLIRETANRIQDNEPVHVQTGPAVRRDTHTLDKHLKLLTAYPKLRTMYMRMTDNIMNP